jgi:nitrate/nitrite transporter NarK
MVGFIWCVFFWRHYHDNPGEHPEVNARELEYIGSHSVKQNADTLVPWRRLRLSRNLWALFWTYFSFAYGFYFFVTWLPTYLRQEHGLNLERSSFYAGLPLGAGAVACLCGGALSDWLYRFTGNLKWSRRLIGMCGSVVASAGFGSVVFAKDPFTAVCCFAVAQAAHDHPTGCLGLLFGHRRKSRRHHRWLHEHGLQLGCFGFVNLGWMAR